MPPTNTTPLHAACRSGDVDMVWILRKNGDSYMGVSLNGGTPKTPQNDHFE